MKPADMECLRRIKATYGPLIDEAAELWGHRPEVLAGIMMRESRGKRPEIVSLDGHDYGLMQINDRTAPLHISSGNWKDPKKNIQCGAHVLALKRQFLVKKVDDLGLIERAAIAAYNCGEGNVWKAIKNNEDIDSRTTGKDYSRAVLEYAEAYRNVELA